MAPRFAAKKAHPRHSFSNAQRASNNNAAKT